MKEEEILAGFLQTYNIVEEYVREGYLFQNDYYGPLETEPGAERSFFIQLPLYTASVLNPLYDKKGVVT